MVTLVTSVMSLSSATQTLVTSVAVTLVRQHYTSVVVTLVTSVMSLSSATQTLVTSVAVTLVRQH